VVILAQTAYAMLGDRQKALDAGCNGYITKPIVKSQLIELIQQYLDTSPVPATKEKP
jgi:CheY-like chemotaxis protein